MFEADAFGDFAGIFRAWAAGLGEVFGELNGGEPAFFVFEKGEGTVEGAAIEPFPLELRRVVDGGRADDGEVGFEGLGFAVEAFEDLAAKKAGAVASGEGEVGRIEEGLIDGKGLLEIAELVRGIGGEDEKAVTIWRSEGVFFEEGVDFDEGIGGLVAINEQGGESEGGFVGEGAILGDDFPEAKEGVIFGRLCPGGEGGEGGEVARGIGEFGCGVVFEEAFEGDVGGAFSGVGIEAVGLGEGKEDARGEGVVGGAGEEFVGLFKGAVQGEENEDATGFEERFGVDFELEERNLRFGEASVGGLCEEGVFGEGEACFGSARVFWERGEEGGEEGAGLGFVLR